MKKKHAIAKFSLIAILCAIVLCLTIFSFALPGSQSDYDFVGFARAINLGIEYQGGTVYEYKVKNNQLGNVSSGIQANVTRINQLLKNNYYDSNVYVSGDNLVVELMDEFSPVSINEIVNTDAYFAVKSEQKDEAEAKIKPEHITEAYASQNGSNVVLMMTFNQEGQDALADMTSSGSGTMYFYFGETVRSMSYSESMNQSYLGITLGGTSLDTAKYFASEINASKYDLSFDETRVVTYSKQDATRNCIVAVVLTVALFAICVAILCARFKKLGLIGSLILFMGLLAQIVLLQAVPVFTLTGPSLFASLLCMIIGEIAIYQFFNNMNAEYKMGKILYASVKFGYRKTWVKILDMFLVMLIPSIITYFFASYLVQHFAMALICGLVVYGFMALVFTNFFSKWLTYIAFKNKDYGFKREANVNELK